VNDVTASHIVGKMIQHIVGSSWAAMCKVNALQQFLVDMRSSVLPEEMLNKKFLQELICLLSLYKPFI
jgi:hypothetical protein